MAGSLTDRADYAACAFAVITVKPSAASALFAVRISAVAVRAEIFAAASAECASQRFGSVAGHALSVSYSMAGVTLVA